MRIAQLLFFLAPLFVYPQQWPEGNEEESLFLRRIADFWQEGEYALAKSQMEEFLKDHPTSAFGDVLSATLGDLYLGEKSYAEALSCYARIQGPEWGERIFLSRMHCLYEMQWYATLADECETKIQITPSKEVTYFLAISLYNQCLNQTDPEALQKLALRAKPHFETLLAEDRSRELLLAFAHLSCMLKEFPQASDIYEELGDEEMLFQAGLVQAEFDKERALETFAKIHQMGQTKSKEAAFNRLVLLHELGRNEELAQAKQEALKDVPPEKQAMVRLFLGQSLLATQQYKEATEELLAYAETAPLENLEPALATLLESATLAENPVAAAQAIQKWKTEFAASDALPKALFARAQTLKRQGKRTEARSELERLSSEFPQFSQSAEAIFESAHLEHQEQNWAVCRSKAEAFLNQFASHSLSPFAVRYLLSASAHGPVELFQKDLLQWGSFAGLSETEKATWEFFLAKTEFDLGDNPENRLQLLLQKEFPEKSDAKLLLALCRKDTPDFALLAEEALKEGARLMPPEQTHILLFNAYLLQNALDAASRHLYAAFEAKAPIQPQNLLWLAEYYEKELEEHPSLLLTKRTASLLEQILKTEAASESIACSLAKHYLTLSQPQEALQLLKPFECKAALHSQNPQPETKRLLAESYLRTGQEELGETLLDQVLQQSHNVRDKTSAAACLQSAKLKILKNRPQALIQLKDLVLQKTLANEPLHLEAALEYAELQKEKKLPQLLKIKQNFEAQDDLLSKDYHAARAQMPHKDRIYTAYMLWIDSEIALLEAAQNPETEKELQGKAKNLLLQITAPPTLVERAALRLKALGNDDPQS